MTRMFDGTRSVSVSALALTAALSSTVEAAVLPFGANADTKAAIALCANERAPLMTKQKEYNDIKRARFQAAVAEGVKAGAGVMIKGMLGGMGGNGQGGLPFVPGGLYVPGASHPAPPAPAASSLMSLVMGNMNGVAVPGMQTSMASSQGAGGRPDTKTLAVAAIFVAVQSSVDTYMRLKQEQYANDARQMAISIEGDAQGQLTEGSESATQVTALSACRQRQVSEFDAKIAGAANDKDRKQLLRDKSGIDGALKADVDMTNDVVNPQITLAKTFTQGRAMAEGKSEADVLGGQQPAYASEASRTVLKLPDPSAPQGQGQATLQTVSNSTPPPPPPQLTLVTIHKVTAVHTAPSLKSTVMLNFPIGRAVTPKGHADGNTAWWEIDMGGAPGYIRGVDLSESDKSASHSSSQSPSKPNVPPPLAPPTNIRAYNQQVLAERTGGPDRLKMLSTEIETGSNQQLPPALALADLLMMDEPRRPEPVQA